MKAKHRCILYAVYVVFGAVLCVLAYFNVVPEALRTYLSSFGFVLLVVGLVKLLRFRSIMTDADKAREFDARMSEERTIFLVGKARSIVLYTSLFVQIVAAVVFQIMDQPLVSQVLCYLTALQGVGYFLIWRYLDHKY